MIFLRILLLALLVFCSFIFGLLSALWYTDKMVIIPLCTILFGSVSGKAADEFCHQCCETERGEKIARLFYIFYNAGYNCTQDPELSKFFEVPINDPDGVKTVLKLANEKLLERRHPNEN